MVYGWDSFLFFRENSKQTKRCRAMPIHKWGGPLLMGRRSCKIMFSEHSLTVSLQCRGHCSLVVTCNYVLPTHMLIYTTTLLFRQYAVLCFKATQLSWHPEGFYILVHILNRQKLQAMRESICHISNISMWAIVSYSVIEVCRPSDAVI